MKIDITLRVTPQMVTDAQDNQKKAFVGHLGTHFDVMNCQHLSDELCRNDRITLQSHCGYVMQKPPPYDRKHTEGAFEILCFVRKFLTHCREPG